MSWYDSEAPYQYLQGPGGWGPGVEEEEEDRRRRGRSEPYEAWGGEAVPAYGPMRGAPRALQRLTGPGEGWQTSDAERARIDAAGTAPRSAAAVDTGSGPSQFVPDMMAQQPRVPFQRGTEYANLGVGWGAGVQPGGPPRHEGSQSGLESSGAGARSSIRAALGQQELPAFAENSRAAVESAQRGPTVLRPFSPDLAITQPEFGAPPAIGAPDADEEEKASEVPATPSAAQIGPEDEDLSGYEHVGAAQAGPVVPVPAQPAARPVRPGREAPPGPRLIGAPPRSVATLSVDRRP